MPRSRRTPEYREYLRSPEWKKKRLRVIRKAHHRCENCGGTYRLEVHHKTYERLGQERMSDLQCLCHDCHKKADRSRLAHARLSGYARKVFGPGWEELPRSAIKASYRSWLTRRRLRKHLHK